MVVNSISWGSKSRSKSSIENGLVRLGDGGSSDSEEELFRRRRAIGLIKLKALVFASVFGRLCIGTNFYIVDVERQSQIGTRRNWLKYVQRRPNWLILSLWPEPLIYLFNLFSDMRKRNQASEEGLLLRDYNARHLRSTRPALNCIKPPKSL